MPEQSQIPLEERIMRIIQGHVAANGPEAVRQSNAMLRGALDALLARVESIGLPESWSVIVTDPAIEDGRDDRRTVYGPYPTPEAAEAAAERLLGEVNRGVAGSGDPILSAPFTAGIAAFFYQDAPGPLTDREEIILDTALDDQRSDPALALNAYEQSLRRRRAAGERAAAARAADDDADDDAGDADGDGDGDGDGGPGTVRP